jgi:hypothetical protein
LRLQDDEITAHIGNEIKDIGEEENVGVAIV